jgi:hypothetical protein
VCADRLRQGAQIVCKARQPRKFSRNTGINRNERYLVRAGHEFVQSPFRRSPLAFERFSMDGMKNRHPPLPPSRELPWNLVPTCPKKFQKS